MPSNACEKLCTMTSLSSKFSDLKVIAGGGSGVVYSGIDNSLASGKDGKVALKKLCLSGKGHCRVALRELRFVKRFQHENIVRTLKIVDENGVTIDSAVSETSKDLCSVFVVEELLDSDLHSVLENCGKLSVNTTKLFAYQLLRGLKYIHSANVLHRDIKPGNLFLRGSDLTLKIGDFGLARVFDSRYCHRGYLTAVVSTRYYRAPEVMLELGNYSFALDIWSAGCVLGEMLLGRVLFCGENDLDQLNVIASSFGVTVDELKQGTEGHFPDSLSTLASCEAVDLLEKMLTLDPAKRITVDDALRHPFFSDLHDVSDEPVCEQPFFIEHEVDNLPLKVLMRKVVRSCCVEEVSKSMSPRSDDAMFRDFDENFSPDLKTACCHLNSQGDETDLSDASSSSSHSKSFVSSLSEEHARFDSSAGFLPSLQEMMTEEDGSEMPCLDPGLASGRIGMEAVATMREHSLNSSSASGPDDSYFSNISPVIDLATRDNFLRQAKTFLKIHGPIVSDCREPAGHRPAAPPGKTDLKRMNEEIVERLAGRNAVSLAQLTHSKLLLSQLRNQYPLLHLESLRFWI